MDQVLTTGLIIQSRSPQHQSYSQSIPLSSRVNPTTTTTPPPPVDTHIFLQAFIGLLGFYVLEISMVCHIEWVPTCDSAHTWRL